MLSEMLSNHLYTTNETFFKNATINQHRYRFRLTECPKKMLAMYAVTIILKNNCTFEMNYHRSTSIGAWKCNCDRTSDQPTDGH